MAMPLVRAAIGIFELDRHIESAAQHVRGLDAFVVGQHGEFIGRRARQHLVAHDAPEHELVDDGRVALDAERVIGHASIPFYVPPPEPRRRSSGGPCA